MVEQANTLINALAEVWAEKDGKLEHYHRERNPTGPHFEEGDFTDQHLGYQAEAKEMIRRLRERCFDIVAMLR